MRKNKSGEDLTTGTPWKVILMFALPLLGSSLIQQCYSMVDLIFVGKYIGKEAAASVGSSDLLITIMVGLFTGISVGAGVAAGQAFGSRNREKLHRLIQSSVTFGVIGSVVIFLVGELGAKQFLIWMNTPKEILPMAVLYLRIYFVGVFAIVQYNLCSGIIRAIGDSAATMRFQIIGGVTNIVVNFILIIVLRWGIVGAAIATVLSQCVAAFLTIRYLMKLEADIALDLRHPFVDSSLILSVLKVGIPSGVQSMIMTFSNILVQSVINGKGVDTIAAFVAYFKVELFIWYPMVALGQAIVTYTAQNIGAGKEERVKKGLYTTILMGFGVAIAIASVLLLLSHQVFGLFSNDAHVISLSISIARITLPLYFLYIIQEAYSGVLKGRGNAIAPMITAILTICGMRIAMLYLFTSLWDGIWAVAIIYPASWGLASIGMFLVEMADRRKRIKTMI